MESKHTYAGLIPKEKVDQLEAALIKAREALNAYEAKEHGGWIVGQSKQPRELAREALTAINEVLS
jgi:hypothetical protein